MRRTPETGSARPLGLPIDGHAVALLAIALFALPSDALTAQDAVDHGPPTAKPGSVVTVPVTLDAPEAHREARASYRVDVGQAARLFGAVEGRVAAEEGRIVLPLTFQLASSAPSGTLDVARVTFRWGPRTTREVTVQVDVPARHRLKGRLTTEVGTVSPGGEATLLFRLTNRGNARDTVRIRTTGRERRWTVRPRRSRVTLEPSEERDVVVLVRAPREATIGQSRQLRLLAEGRGEVVRADVLLRVVEDEGWLPGMEHLPTRLFVGSTAGGAGAGDVVAAVRAQGTLGTDTDVSLRGRYRPTSGSVQAFRRDVSGPSFRLDIRRPAGSLTLGDVYASSAPLAGSFQSGEGVDVRYRGDRFFGEVFAARPSLGADPDGGGRSLLASGGLQMDTGRTGVTLSEQRWPRLTGGDAWSRSAGAHLDLDPAPRQHVRVEAGLKEVGSGPGERAVGFAGEAEYSLYGTETTVDARVRRVPGAVRGGGGRGNEVFLRGTRRLDADVHALAHGRWSTTPLLDASRRPEIREVGTGVRYDPGQLRLEGLLRYRESSGILPGEGWRTRRTAVLSADVPVGPVHVDGSVELGTESGSVADGTGFRRLRATARWSDESSWMWLTAGEEQVPGFSSRWHAELQGGTRHRRLELSGGAAVEDGLGEARIRLWARLGYEVTPGLSLVAETERRPATLASPEWRMSLGVEKALSLPLPLPSTPVAHGTVFDDRNGNLQRDAGEPGLPGVRLRKGFAEAVTDERGQFEFRQEAVRGRSLEVVGASLPTGALVPSGARYPDDGETAIPVVRTAALQLVAFLDRDGDGRRDSGEPAASGARIDVESSAGRRRTVEADETGRARIGGLRPGRYTVTVRVPAEGMRLPASATFEIELRPGESAAEEVPLEARDRTVRY